MFGTLEVFQLRKVLFIEVGYLVLLVSLVQVSVVSVFCLEPTTTGVFFVLVTLPTDREHRRQLTVKWKMNNRDYLLPIRKRSIKVG